MFAVIIASTVSALVGNLLDPAAPIAKTINALLVPTQFILFAVIGLGAIALFQRKWPGTKDLALKTGLSVRDLIIIGVAFVVSHLAYWAAMGGQSATREQAMKYFQETGMGGPLLSAVAAVTASVLLAPVCEELLYRGAIMRPIHDAIARRGSKPLAAIVSILVAAAAFALPHLDQLTGGQAISYLLTGITFGVAYLLTGSMTAAMVSHSLQSAFSFGQVLLFGRGDASVSPIIWILIFGTPLWTFLVARLLHAIFPKR